MSVRSHILIMLVATLLAWIAWLLVLVNVNPTQAAWWGFALFYVTFFLSVFGSFAVVGFLLRSILKYRRFTTRYKVTTSIRQAALWALALVIVLALQGQGLLTWWSFLLALLTFILVEYFVLSLQKYKSHS